MHHSPRSRVSRDNSPESGGHREGPEDISMSAEFNANADQSPTARRDISISITSWESVMGSASRDWAVNLPEVFLLRMCRYLSPTSLLSVAQVCRKWKRVSEDSTIWRKLYSKRWPTFRTKSSTFSSNLAASSPSNLCSWKEMYMNRVRFTLNKGISLFNSVDPQIGK